MLPEPCFVGVFIHSEPHLVYLFSLKEICEDLCVIDLPICMYMDSGYVEFALVFQPILLYILSHCYCLPVTITAVFHRVSTFIYPDWNRFIDASKTITSVFLNCTPEHVFASSFQNVCLLYVFLNF